MHTRIPLLLLIEIVVISIYSFSQNETNHWVFSDHAGLDFSTGSPVPEPGNLLAWEGSAAISDPVTGNLLMYTDGETVYAANHIPMPNGTGLNGHVSSAQSAIIIPRPGSTTQFYIFTTDSGENNGVKGLNYSVVDMTLNGGLGDVVPSQKNMLLFAPCNEQLSAVKHANCTDWWIMAKERGNGNNVYKAFQLTGTGVLGPINSTIGVSTDDYAPWQAKFSPDGTKYAIAGVGLGLTQLFDFDNATGLLSNVISLNMASDEFSNALSFSGDNSKLYVGCTSSLWKIYQYDLSSGIPATMNASITSLGDIPLPGQFQIGKDFKIYIVNGGISSLSVISNPNAPGVACGFSLQSIPITGTCTIGICNFPDSYFNQSSPCPTSGGDIPEEEEEVELTPHIPNIITPNGDGVNDVFKIDNLPAASSLEILNRWGNLMFTTDNYTNDWMGHNSDGTYFYVLKTPNGKTFNGFVQVVTDR